MKPDGREDESTGLPGLTSWPRVYAFVGLSFALWVGLMVALEWRYR